MKAAAAPAEFWTWFAANERRFRGAMESESAKEELFDETVAQLHAYCPSLYFQVGGAPGGPLELVITAEGDASFFPQVEELVGAAPAIPGWLVVAYMPASGFEFTTRYEGVTVDPSACWFLPLASATQPGKLGLRVACPNYDEGEHDSFACAVHIVLQTGIGEQGFARDIHHVEVGSLPETPDAEGFIELPELPKFLEWHRSPGRGGSA